MSMAVSILRGGPAVRAPRLLGGTLAAALALASTACVDLKAVTATSQVGESLATYEEPIRLLDETCHLGRVLIGASRCPKDLAKWQKALAMLVAYSRGLDRAANSKPPSVSDAVGGALDQAGKAGWLSLSSGAEDAVEKVASGIAAFLSREATRRSIQQAIREVGDALDTVVQLLVAHLALERAYLLGVRCQVACRAGLPLDPAQCPEIAMATCQTQDDVRGTWFFELEARLDVQDAALDRASTVIAAFGKAHRHLYDQVEHLGAADLYKAVVDDVSFTASAATSNGAAPANGASPADGGIP
jgi:hypothetical protein